jgi:hypothetical protein
MMKRMSGWVGCMVVALVLAACSAAPRAEGSVSEHNILTAEEIATVNVMTLYDAVHRLRPRWLEVRAPRTFGGGVAGGVLVFIDRTLLGGTDELRRVSPGDYAWLEYLTGSEAAARLHGIHSGNIEGAIILHVRPRERR